MNSQQSQTFRHVAFTHFVPCLFIGITMLYVLNAFFPHRTDKVFIDNIMSLKDLALSFMNGLLVAGAALIFHLVRNYQLSKKHKPSRRIASKRKITYATTTGFIAGFVNVTLGLYTEGILPLTLIVIIILYYHLRAFSHQVGHMLKPGQVATWRDVEELMRTYMTMLAGFTLINASLDGAHLMTGTTPPFGFYIDGGDIFLNSLYYTVVTMTTLGFGDIVPKTWDGKLLLIVQCLVSYFMFALVIGIITRGVLPTNEKPDRQGRRAS